MKTVVIFSVVTFVIMFGGVFLLSSMLQQSAAQEPETVPTLEPEDYEAAERVMRDLTIERDRIQAEKEELLALRQMVSVEEQVLQQTQARLQQVITTLEGEQRAYNEEKERSARKLAKRYEAMKPASAAPVISSLDMEIILEIMDRMKEKPAAKILSYMDAGLAAQVSTRMSLKGVQ